MKKFIILVAALFVLLPVVANAEAKGVNIDGLAKAEPITDEETGTFTKQTTIYITTSGKNADVTSAVVRFRPYKNKNSEVTNISCEGTSPYSVNMSTDDEGYTVCTFKVAEGTNGEKGAKVAVGTLIVTIPTSASNCDIEADFVDGKGNVSTGANLNLILIGCGVAAVGAIYFATNSKKKLYNI